MSTGARHARVSGGGEGRAGPAFRPVIHSERAARARNSSPRSRNPTCPLSWNGWGGKGGEHLRREEPGRALNPRQVRGPSRYRAAIVGADRGGFGCSARSLKKLT